MHAWLDWLSALPAPLLYGAILIAAFAENLFPPLPADTVVALGAFVAARGDGSVLGAWAATMIGNLAGAMSMFYIGKRLGIPWLSKRLPRIFPEEATRRVATQFRARGLIAVAISRFFPGVRAVVPPVAGAIGIAPLRAAIAMSLASGVWYAIVCVLAYGAGENADALLDRIAAQQRLFAALAFVVVLGGVALMLWRRRRPQDAP
jgi:membrane protein DedA with SNARE-associated domain